MKTIKKFCDFVDVFDVSLFKGKDLSFKNSNDSIFVMKYCDTIISTPVLNFCYKLHEEFGIDYFCHNNMKGICELLCSYELD